MLTELSRKLESKKFKLPLTLQKLILEQVSKDARLVIPTNDLPINSRDPDDNNVLQVALFVKANFIITGDRDLLDLKEVGGVTIINPSDFYQRYIA
ncbi:hypothetical protein GCM10028818_10990 [Spirosoma horti]